MRSVLSRTVDRLLHTVAIPAPAIPPEVLEFHASVPVVDLVVGTPLFRGSIAPRRRHGHVDLPRLIEGGVDLVGFTVATRHPDLRGTLSTPHFWSLGLSTRVLRSDMAIAEAIIGRVEAWSRHSRGRLRLARSSADLTALIPGRSAVSAFIGIQGGHVLGGDPGNVWRLADRGVRMFALAHVMDNALVGSNTGRRRAGLTGLGLEVVAELERAGVMVDLAHMSVAGIQDILPHLRRPFVLSHSGLTRLAGQTSRLPGRRFTPAARNVADREARMVAEAGGLIGLTLSTRLLGGADLDAVVRAVHAALELAGTERVALGSDMDGGLRTVTDARGLPAVTAALLASGLDRTTVAAFLGANALRRLKAAWEVDTATGSRGPRPAIVD